MLKKFFLGFCLVYGLEANAEDMYMHVRLADGSYKVINTEQVHRITFNDGNMIATDHNGQNLATVPTSSISLIGFDESSEAGLAEVAADGNFSIVGACVTISQGSGTFEVYDMAGKTVVSIPDVKAGTRIDLSVLSAGTYVMTFDNHTIKVAVK